MNCLPTEYLAFDNATDGYEKYQKAEALRNQMTGQLYSGILTEDLAEVSAKLNRIRDEEYRKFKTGDKIEVSNDNENWQVVYFYQYCFTNMENPWKATELFSGLDNPEVKSYNWKYAR
jgi:hypothetical protein